MAPLPSALSPPAASRGPVPSSGPRGGAAGWPARGTAERCGRRRPARGIEQGPLGGGGERMGPRPASRARGTAVGERGHGGRRASSSLPAAEAASERLGGRGIDAGPTRSARALHALGMARAEPCASFEYDIENAAAAFSSLSSLSIWHRERLREPTAGSLRPSAVCCGGDAQKERECVWASLSTLQVAVLGRSESRETVKR